MYQRIHDLLDGGVPLGRIIYVNFEDECLMEMTVADLNLILEVGYDLSGGENRMCFSMRSRTLLESGGNVRHGTVENVSHEPIKLVAN